MSKKITYKFKPVNVEANNVEDIKFPSYNQRIILKQGADIEFTMAELEEAVKSMKKTLVELEAKKKFEQSKIDNIEHHHPFVKDMSPQDLNTAALYNESKKWVKQCTEKIALFEEALESDEKEMLEIKSQIKELNQPVESPYDGEEKDN